MNNEATEHPKDSGTHLNGHGNKRGMHPNSRKNLANGHAPWQKGESGNPNGLTITARQKEKMSEVCPFDPLGREWREALAEAGMRMALTIPIALSHLQDRQEGKVAQPLTGADGKDLLPEIETLYLIAPEGTKIKPGRMDGNGHKSQEVNVGGDGRGSH